MKGEVEDGKREIGEVLGGVTTCDALPTGLSGLVNKLDQEATRETRESNTETLRSILKNLVEGKWVRGSTKNLYREPSNLHRQHHRVQNQWLLRALATALAELVTGVPAYEELLHSFPEERGAESLQDLINHRIEWLIEIQRDEDGSLFAFRKRNHLPSMLPEC